MRYKRAIFAAVGVVTIGILLSYVGCSLRWRHVEKGFERISMGESKERIVAEMGKPSEHGAWGLVAGFGYHTSNCMNEFVYRDPFLLPDGYLVLFDQSDHVIGKSTYSSA